jgi:hypothetical protein
VAFIGKSAAIGSWSGYVIVSVSLAAGATALPFNASADAAASPPSCRQGGSVAVWRVVLTTTARVAVVACGAGAGDAGRSVYSATVEVLRATVVRVQFSIGGEGMTMAVFGPDIRAKFLAGLARGLGVDVLRVRLIQVL